MSDAWGKVEVLQERDVKGKKRKEKRKKCDRQCVIIFCIDSVNKLDRLNVMSGTGVNQCSPAAWGASDLEGYYLNLSGYVLTSVVGDVNGSRDSFLDCYYKFSNFSRIRCLMSAAFPKILHDLGQSHRGEESMYKFCAKSCGRFGATREHSKIHT